MTLSLLLCVIELLIFNLVFLPRVQLLVLPEVLCNVTIEQILVSSRFYSLMPKGCSLDLSQLNCGKGLAVSSCNELACFNVCYANLVDKNLINCDVLNLGARGAATGSSDGSCHMCGLRGAACLQNSVATLPRLN